MLDEIENLSQLYHHSKLKSWIINVTINIVGKSSNYATGELSYLTKAKQVKALLNKAKQSALHRLDYLLGLYGKNFSRINHRSINLYQQQHYIEATISLSLVDKIE